MYAGRVGHIRHTPFRHKFDYRIWMLAVDLDRIDEVARNSRLFAHNKAGLIAIHDKDHGFRDGRSLRAFAEDALAQQGFREFGARIVFVTMPRLLGYAFNPISFYYCYNAQGQLGAVLHQVKNTFGGQIGYLLPVHGDGLIRQSAPKLMYVSPFFDMQGGYRFALTPPGEKLAVSIQYGTAEAKRMTATMVLKPRPFTDASILRLAAEMPLAPMKVMFAIHWQALKIFLRGAKFHSVPLINHETVIAGERE
ncbi:MAG: DUF1365 domain-containing protein [Acidocella sp. 20-57-95]|nr:MAG: DUF1365 domain-containing protein [Acidocella sp. 20-57-95]